MPQASSAEPSSENHARRKTKRESLHAPATASAAGSRSSATSLPCGPAAENAAGVSAAAECHVDISAIRFDLQGRHGFVEQCRRVVPSGIRRETIELGRQIAGWECHCGTRS
jgi:hypothetical protein